MKTKMKSVLIAGVAGLAVTTMFAQSSTTQEIVNYSVKVVMSNTGADPDTTGASGTVQATEATTDTAKRNTDKETLNVTAKGLDPLTDYTVSAVQSESNTPVGSATTDKKGNLKASFSTNTKGKKNLGPPPTPLTSVTEVDVVNSNSVTVLVADMNGPTSLKYTVRKDVADSDSGEVAALTVSSNTKHAMFGLSASALNPGEGYFLLFNGKVVQTNNASGKGTLKFLNPLVSTNVVTPFVLQTVEVAQTNGTPAFSTTIP